MVENEETEELDDYIAVTPPMNDPSRLSSTKSSSANLIATMLGGGVLSLPFAFSRAGVLLSLVYLFISAYLNAYSINLLFTCSRITGCVSYEDLASFTYGNKLKNLCKFIVFLSTFGGIIGYCILIRDLSFPLLESYVFPTNLASKYSHLNNFSSIGLITLISPLCFFSNLKALQQVSKICVISIMLLLLILTFKLMTKPESNVEIIASEPILWFSTEVKDSLFTFPLLQIAFICHFNVLPVYTTLKLPTKKRLHRVINLTISFSFLIYLLIGLIGYFYAFDLLGGVQDNILNNFPENDFFIDLGRLCLLCTLLLSLPLLVLPSRHILISFFKPSRTSDTASTTSNETEEEEEEEENDSLQKPLLTNSMSSLEREHERDLNEMLKTRRKSLLFSFSTPKSRTSLLLTVMHYLITLLLLASSLTLMIYIKNISIIWNIVGSSIGFFISYSLPCLFYLKVSSNIGRGEQQRSQIKLERKRVLALLIFSIVLGTFCTYNSINEILS